ncbi:fork head domain-containing protein, partial [Dichotomocladium elegans]
AYAKLEGQEYCYYIRTLQVTLGRQVAKPDSVDIPLGNARSVSRHHARLFYNFATQRFELMVFGKNGAFVNERFVEKGVTVPLENRTKIKIGGSTFLFLLPRIKGIEHQHQQRPPMRVPSELNTSQDRKGDGAGGEKEIKPPVSYATLIAQAISSTQDKRMALHDIYNYIANNYPYYKVTQSDWQNSIRHNLSLNKAFVKVPRNDAQPGKGGFWAIDPTADMDFHFSIANNYMINNSANPHKRAICTSSGDEIQMQLQTTIRQHLLDPVRNPLPPSIAQLLPHAIAQLPPHLAVQFSSTLQS